MNNEELAAEMTDIFEDLEDLDMKFFRFEELNPAPYNPRKKLKPGDKEYEKLKTSIKTFGYVDPIIVNIANNNTVISGHQRMQVMMDMGKKGAKCVVVSYDLENEKALNITMNNVNGEWDVKKLADVLDSLKEADFDLGKASIDEEQYNDVMSQAYDKNVKEDNFDVESELKQPAFSKPGDIWHIGRHTVICGDSTDPATYEALLSDRKVNLVLTDAPYFVNLQNKSGTIANDNLNDKEAYEFLMKVFSNFKNAMAEDASFYEFYATMKSRIFYDAFEDAGFRVGAQLVWKKPRAPFMRTDWKFNMEPIIFGWRKDGKHKWYGDQKQKAVFEFDGIKDSEKEGFGHPSSKPVQLLAYLINLSTMTNGVVLDGFLGSASTLIACEQTDRVCFGVELEEKYVDVAAKRYIAFKNGHYDDVYVIRDGQKLAFDEVAAFEPEGGDPHE